MQQIPNSGFIPLRFYRNGSYTILHPDSSGHWIFTTSDGKNELSTWKLAFGLFTITIVIIVTVFALVKLYRVWSSKCSPAHMMNVVHGKRQELDDNFLNRQDFIHNDNRNISPVYYDTHVAMDNDSNGAFTSVTEPLLENNSTLL